MSERKETPDILGSVLGQPAEPQRVPDIMPDPQHKQAPARRTRKKAAPKVKRQKPNTAEEPTIERKPVPRNATAWEYRDVTFYDYGGYVVRYIGGEEVADWKRRKAGMSDYINRMGSKGWEMVGLISPKRYHILVIFKRPKRL